MAKRKAQAEEEDEELEEDEEEEEEEEGYPGTRDVSNLFPMEFHTHEHLNLKILLSIRNRP